ncbi:conserved membrane hypothetical protein [uncultured Paludibacter sp.]|uniref:Uncharacterized protein n=1 Tax=uncultured Paludibacter sp. TaxID=497635 RepID=A0A653AFX5_9BACT|nr:conserved membrane hypothetical protein [uncultured Paludibacter sp.]
MKNYDINNKSRNKKSVKDFLGGLSIFDLDRWQEIWQAITHNKFRSVLTGFGVFWGMFMLVVMVGAGIALQRGMQQNIEGFATNSCFASDGVTSEPYKGFKKGRYWNIVNEDLDVLRNKIPEMQYLSPVLFGGRSGNGNNTVRGEKSGSFNSKGVLANYNEIDRCKLIYGRYINDIDNEGKRKVCVIGERVYEVLFNKGENPVGKYIKLNGIYFQVIGVAQKLAQINIGGNTEETVVLPLSTMQQVFNQGNKVHFLAITAQPGIKVSVVEKRVQEELKKLHNIAPNDKTGVWTMNIEDQFTMFLYLGIGIASLIWIVGLGTLTAGGIGVSNIMLVTVKERTKEIGIKRALGATPRNIITQIMTESVILTLIAGVSGLMFGVGILTVVGILLNNGDGFFKDPQISFSVAIASLFIIIIIGVFAGYMPAHKAMKIKAIEAIRQEN